MRERDNSQVGGRARLILDYGVDEQFADHLVMDDRGMSFQSRWEFSIGSRISVGCASEHPLLRQKRVRIEGIVVWCERHQTSSSPEQRPLFDTTLLFLELPEDLRENLREFSCQLPAAA